MIKVSRLHRVNNSKSIKAFADIIINDLVLIKGVRLLEGNNYDLYVAMPQQKAKDGKWYDTVKLLDDMAKEELEDAVIEAYSNKE